MDGGDSPEGQNVYVVEHEHGYIKIGVSNNPKVRLDSLQTGCPYELHLLGEIFTDEPFSVESNLHEKYDGQQKNGEWYDLHTDQKIHLLALCDLGLEAVNQRYANPPEKRRELTLTMQGLVG